MHQVEIIVLLFATVAVLAVIARKVALPYPIVLVISGLALSFIPRLPEVKLNPEIVFYFFLPPLLYPAALFTSWRDFKRNLRPILLLAIGLVLVTTVTIAWVAHTILPGLPWAAAFALGAIVSPPDAVSATAVLRRLPVPPPYPDNSRRRKSGKRRDCLGGFAIRSCRIDDRHFLFGTCNASIHMGRSRRHCIRVARGFCDALGAPASG